MSILVRPATLDDIPWLMTQLREFDRFAGYKRSLMEDEAHARAGILGIIEKHVAFIAVEQNNRPDIYPLGFIAGYKTPHPFNPNIRVLTELFWWVAIGYRHGRAGAMLLSAFMDYGEKNCDWIVMSLEHVSPVHPESLIRRGFNRKEESFLLEVQ